MFWQSQPHRLSLICDKTPKTDPLTAVIWLNNEINTLEQNALLGFGLSRALDRSSLPLAK
jgi:hypothetical protein